MQTGKAPTLLIVDDSATARKMIMSSLRPLAPQFFEAGSGLEAIEKLALGTFDAVTLDLNMPDMHGLEFLNFLRSHCQFTKMPVVVISTRSDEHMRATIMAAGANRYVTKPFTPQDILNAVQAVLHSH